MRKNIFSSRYLSRINKEWMILLLVTLTARGLSYYEVTLSKTTWLNMFETRGVFSDAITAYVIAIIVALCARFKVLQAITYCAYSFLLASNVQNIHFNYSNLSLNDTRFLSEKEFMVGSVTSYELLGCWGGLFILMLLGSLLLRKLHFSTGWNKNFAVGQCVILVALFFVEDKFYRPYWQDYNMLEENILGMLEIDDDKVFVESPELQAGYDKVMKLNLRGKSVLDPSRKKRPNILIISIEGLSEAFITEEIMPNLYKLAQNNIHYKYFLNHQRFTENGLYSMLCGDMPTLYRRQRVVFSRRGRDVLRSNKSLHHKWGVVGDFGSATPCLPKALKTVGYKTAFYQASSLSFTNKAGFMRNAGMDIRFGHRSLLKRYKLTRHEKKKKVFRGFGLADIAFYPRVFNELKKLNKDKPWFATTMNTATHFPLYVDHDLKFPFHNKRNRAFYTADHELGKFISKIRAEGMLEDTMIFITGDESAAFPEKNNSEGMLVNNWGAMVILAPNRKRYVSDEFFTQSDIMSSILDYIDHPELAIRGRSMFREYNTFRPLIFANIRTDRWYAWYKKENLIACTGFFKKCRTFAVGGKNILDGSLSMIENDPELVKHYIDIAKKSDVTNIRKEKKRRKRKKRK